MRLRDAANDDSSDSKGLTVGSHRLARLLALQIQGLPDREGMRAFAPSSAAEIPPHGSSVPRSPGQRALRLLPWASFPLPEDRDQGYYKWLNVGPKRPATRIIR